MPTQTSTLAVTQLVATLHHQADLIRARAGLLASGSRAMRWQGAGSRQFHHGLDDVLRRLSRCADEFDDAADAILTLTWRH